ncbi:hypothetical protein HPA02_08410 [Bisbaumannia pacifica]|uniref:DUF4376 domain-containing protein n=1 Tax=Bisbaumannia pacifica TaxID=77098 RepID=A0A510X556_9GAMM|nr:DUF4376 domain-containing protein [Halomonas pacifica]GEK46558.1 hypothetical protein HPA02_08410 [Halomonas pacifica]
MQVITTSTGRALEHDGEQVPLPALPVDATVHAYTTPAGLWVGIQEPGQLRPVYPGAGGQRLGALELEADPAAVAAQCKARLVAELEPQRKAAEAEGVMINGVRYAGDPSNRQALGEALEYAASAGVTTFSGWKDSDDQFHAEHPVADVQAAYEAIGHRRSALIALEGQYAAQVIDGTLVSVAGLSWEVSQ